MFYFISFVFGMFVGGMVASLIGIVTMIHQAPIKRVIKKVVNKLSSKGEILEPKDESLEGWMESLQQNDTTQ